MAKRTPDQLQTDLTNWHVLQFPDAIPEGVAMKLAEEVGEVCKALQARTGERSGTGGGNIWEEIGDVGVCLSVLLGRYFPGVTLHHLIENTLDRKLVRMRRS